MDRVSYSISGIRVVDQFNLLTNKDPTPAFDGHLNIKGPVESFQIFINNLGYNLYAQYINLVGSRARQVTHVVEPRKPRVLLIGESPRSSSYLARRLEGRGCELAFAVSHEEACSLFGVRGFDLVLSPLRLPGGSAFFLVGILEGCPTTLFFFEPVENGCWWLPALRNGSNCFGSSALLPSEFVAVLDEVIEEIWFRAAKERNRKQSVLSSLPGSAATTPSWGELPHAEPRRTNGQDALRSKAAV